MTHSRHAQCVQRAAFNVHEEHRISGRGFKCKEPSSGKAEGLPQFQKAVQDIVDSFMEDVQEQRPETLSTWGDEVDEAFGASDEWLHYFGAEDEGGSGLNNVPPEELVDASTPVPGVHARCASFPFDLEVVKQALPITPDVPWARGVTCPSDLQGQQQRDVCSGKDGSCASGASWDLLPEEQEGEEELEMESSLRRRLPFLTRQQLQEAVESVSELGRGSYGAVYLVRYEGAPAALKTLLPPASVALLLQEARLLLELDGAGGMPRVLAVCRAPPALLLEYVGRTYEQFLAGCSLGGLVDSLTSIAERLGELHARGVVHNDLKANNVTFTGTPDEPVFHVIDCGLSCRAGHVADCYVREGDEALFPWVAPEVARREPVFPSGDVFSLGALIKELLPLVGDAQPAVLARLQQLASACTVAEPWPRLPLAMVTARLRVLRRELPPSAARHRLAGGL